MDRRAKRPPADSLDDAELYWKAIEPLWDKVDIYHGPKKYLRELARFAKPQQLLFAAHWCQAEVMNGGLDQFFSNDTGVVAPEAVRGLELVGMRAAARVVEKAMGRFGRQYPRERTRRLDWLADASPEGDLFGALDGRLFSGRADLSPFEDCANEFVRAHLDQFFKPGDGKAGASPKPKRSSRTQRRAQPRPPKKREVRAATDGFLQAILKLGGPMKIYSSWDEYVRAHKDDKEAEPPPKPKRSSRTQWHALPRSARERPLRSVTIDSVEALRELCATKRLSSVDEIVLSEGLSEQSADILGATTGPKLKKLSFHVAWDNLDEIVDLLKGHPLCGRVELLNFDMYVGTGEPGGELFKALKRLSPLQALTMACATGRIEEGRRTAEIDVVESDARFMIRKLPQRLDDITVRIDHVDPDERIDVAYFISDIGERNPAHAHVPAAWIEATK